jgi:transposase
METKDMRSLSPEAREERRRLVVRLRKKGLTHEAIAEQTGRTRTGVFDICKRVAEQGAAGLVDKPVGRKLGTGRALTAEQEAQVQKLSRDKTPAQLKMVKAWLAEHSQKIEVFYLPSYSPELNPDECLNADLKAAVTSKAPARAKGQLEKVAISHLRKLQKSPARVRKYFQHRPVRYAA